MAPVFLKIAFNKMPTMPLPRFPNSMANHVMSLISPQRCNEDTLKSKEWHSQKTKISWFYQEKVLEKRLLNGDCG